MSISEILTNLSNQIGKEIHVGPWLTITQERINQFAEATNDKQWIHTDLQRAKKESPFGTTIAHGYLTLSLLPYLTESLNPNVNEYPGMRMGINYGTNKIRFPHPVKVGAKIRARTHLLDAEEVNGGIQIIKKVTIEIEGEEKPACVAETIVRILF